VKKILIIFLLCIKSYATFRTVEECSDFDSGTILLREVPNGVISIDVYNLNFKTNRMFTLAINLEKTDFKFVPSEGWELHKYSGVGYKIFHYKSPEEGKAFVRLLEQGRSINVIEVSGIDFQNPQQYYSSIPEVTYKNRNQTITFRFNNVDYSTWVTRFSMRLKNIFSFAGFNPRILPRRESDQCEKKPLRDFLYNLKK
jgi:hypothetical protein